MECSSRFHAEGGVPRPSRKVRVRVRLRLRLS